MSCNCNECTCESKGREFVVTVLSTEEILYAQKLAYEKDGLLSLLTQFTSDSPFKPDEERYDKLLEEYICKFTEYSLLFNSYSTIYKDLISKHITNTNYQLKIDFGTGQLIVAEI